MKVNKKRLGFTLVELVIVIAILGILAALAIPRLGQARETAKIATHNGNVRIVKSAAMMILADNPDEEDDFLKNVEEYFDGEKMPETPYGLDKYGVEGGKKYMVEIVDQNIKVSPDPIEK